MEDKIIEMIEMEELPDRIAKTFDGKTVLLTGGTGFMGKVLLEKLLRKCPDIGGIIMLIRPKKGKDPKQRIEQIFQGELFEPLVKEQGMDYVMSRTRIVSGDVSVSGLGMSEADRQTCRSANIIVHSAASVRFDEGLKSAVLLNTRGTKSMLDLAKECLKLELFVHVSTAYCHPEIKVLEEKPYPPPSDPLHLIEVFESTADHVVDGITSQLLGSWPNTYAYSKALSEALVSNEMANLPAVIIRPSVVVPVYKEPIRGWTDNINGPAGLLIAAGKGVLRSMYGDDSIYADFMPVDVFANALMISVWNFLQNGGDKQRVLNFTSSHEVRMSWSEMLEIGRRIATTKVPLNNIAWYPGGSMTNSRTWHRFRLVMFHWLPALFVDILLFCLGIKPVLLRVQRRISKGMEVFEYYTSNQWEFKSDFMQSVREQLNAKEKNDYKIDSEGFDPEEYFEVCIRACRRYILRETDDTLPAARRHMNIMWVVDTLVKTLFWGLMLYWMFTLCSYYGLLRFNSTLLDKEVHTIQ